MDAEKYYNNQKKVLESIIRMDGSISENKKKLQIGWELPEQFEDRGPLAILTTQNLMSVLMRFLDKELVSQEVYEWAETLNGREMGVIDYEKGYRDVIGGIMHTITMDHDAGFPINERMAEKYISNLKFAIFDPSDD